MAALLLPLQLSAADTDNDSPKVNSAQDIQLIKRLIYQEKYSAAIKKLKHTLKSDEKNADKWNLLGYASRKSGDTDGAETAYKKALSINEDHLGALEYQGELFIILGRLEDAQKNLDHLTRLCPNGCEEQEELAEAIAKSN